MRRFVKPILCVGDAHPDIIVDSNKRNITDKLCDEENPCDTPKNHIKMVGGGTVGNVAVALGRLGEPPHFIGNVGKDIFGDFMLKYFENEGIATDGIFKNENKGTEIVFCFIDAEGDYSYCSYPEVAHIFDSIKIPEISDDVLQQFDLLYTSGACLLGKELAADLLSVFKRCKKMNIPIAFDLNFRTTNYGEDQRLKSLYKDAVKYVNILFGSEKKELAAFMEEDINEAIKDLLDQDKIIISKSGKEGAAVYTRSESYQMPAFQVEVVDTVGAGDVFNGGFLAAYAKGKRLSECLLWGCAASGYSVQFTGSGNAPGEYQLKRFIETNGKTVKEIRSLKNS